MKQHQLVSSDEAPPTTGQPTTPCSDCPWSRDSIPGWLGGATVDDWLTAIQSDEPIDCHALKGPQCAGAAIYRGNTFKLPRDPGVLRLDANKTHTFSGPDEFREHHRGGQH